MAASNTDDCFRECIGRKVKGFLKEGAKRTIVFDDGTGLTINSNGAFWRENSNDIERAIRERRVELAAAKRDIEDVLIAAGEAV